MIKKVLLVLAFVMGFTSFSQNELNLGINGGVVVDLSDYSDIAFGADVNYLFDVSRHFKAGPSVGLSYYVAELDGTDDAIFLPVGGALRFHSIDDKFFAGFDLGYGVSLSDFVDGGLYFKPLIGYRITEEFRVNVFYSGVRTFNEDTEPVFSTDTANPDPNFDINAPIGEDRIGIRNGDGQFGSFGYVGIGISFNFLGNNSNYDY